MSLSIARTVTSKRTQLGISQEKLAQLSGVDRTQISRIENGHCNPSLNTLTSLSSVFSCSVSDLLEPLACQDILTVVKAIWGTVSSNLSITHGIPMLLVGKKGNIIECNEAFTYITEYTKEDLPFLDITKWMPVTNVPKSGRYNINIPVKSGGYIKVSIELSTISDDSSLPMPILLAIITDKEPYSPKFSNS